MTSESTKTIPKDDLFEYVEVVYWNHYQYSDRRKNPNPPWPWFRLQASFLRSPEWLGMSKPMRADFIAVLSAANATGNMIPVCKSWLRAFELTPNILQKLNKTELTRSFSLPPDHKRIKDLRRIFSGALPPSEAEAEAETEKKGQLSPFPSCDGSRYELTKNLAKDAPNELNAGPPLALNGLGRGGGDKAGAFTRPGEHTNCKNTPRWDRRPFPQLKKAVLPIAQKFNTRDPDEIFRFGGQSLKISAKQCREVVKQLIEDGDL